MTLNKLLLLPNAAPIPGELQVDFGDIPSGMIPLNSRPAMHHVAKPYVEAGYRVVVGAHHQIQMVEHYLSRCPESNSTTLNVGKTSSIAETISTVLHSLQDMPELLVINFADTLVENLLVDGDAICYSEMRDLYRWTAFDFDEAGAITRLYPKNQLKPGDGPRPVMVGVFGFADPVRFRNLLDSAIGRSSTEDPFWEALTHYHHTLSDKLRTLVRVAAWHDFGHLDRYYAAQKAVFLNARYFNNISVDLGRGVIRKASSHAKKLSNEVAWYQSLPKELQYLAPRVFDVRHEADSVSVEMEFYGYPALNDVYLYGNWDPGVWGSVLEAMGRALDGMQSKASDTAIWMRQGALRDMYETKTVERLTALLDNPQFAATAGEETVINGRVCPGLRSLLRRLGPALEKLGLFNDEPFTIIHGDLCLSNILFDRRSGFVRLVDPRGAFGHAGIYGDPRYDLAKLSHSFSGDYDFLLNGLFSYRENENHVSLDVFRRPCHDVIKQIFQSWLLGRVGPRYRSIRLIESLLFLSMVPLHSDRPQSQLAFLARGLELFQIFTEEQGDRSIQFQLHGNASLEHNYHNGW